MSGHRPQGGRHDQFALLHPFRDEHHKRGAARHMRRETRHFPHETGFFQYAPYPARKTAGIFRVTIKNYSILLIDSLKKNANIIVEEQGPLKGPVTWMVQSRQLQ